MLLRDILRKTIVTSCFDISQLSVIKSERKVANVNCQGPDNKSGTKLISECNQITPFHGVMMWLLLTNFLVKYSMMYFCLRCSCAVYNVPWCKLFN
jgi:hypothetical protein